MNKEQEKSLGFNCPWMRGQDSSMPYSNFMISLQTAVVQQGKKEEVSACNGASFGKDTSPLGSRSLRPSVLM